MCMRECGAAHVVLCRLVLLLQLLAVPVEELSQLDLTVAVGVHAMKISSIILLVGVCPRLLSMRASSLRSMAPEPSRSVSKKAVLACASSASERVERTAYAAAELFCDDRSMCVWADVCV